MGAHSRIPGAVRRPVERRSRPARPEDNDRRGWVTGMCWLCRRTEVPVIWLGPVSSSGMQAPLHGCEECTAELDRMVWDYFMTKDAPSLSRVPDA